MKKLLEKIQINQKLETTTTDFLGNEKIEDLDQSTANLTSQSIIDRANEIKESVKELTPEEQSLVYNEMLKDYGLTLEKLTSAMGNLDPSLPPSAIFPQLGVLPISEMLQRVSIEFDFADLIPYKIITNGLHRIFYKDFRKTDGLSAYNQGDYQFDPIHNPLGGIVVEEIWKCYMNIHAGFTMWNPSLNQNTRSVELFIAMFNELEWNIGKPIAQYLYRFRLKLLAEDIEFNGVLDTNPTTPRGTDWSKLTPDITIEGADDYQALEKLFTFIVGLNQSSRRNLPTRWNPTGMVNNLMTRFKASDYVLVGPVEFIQHLNVSMKSGRFNEEYLKLLTEFYAIDYDKSFGEFNGDTNYKTTFSEADLRLVPRPSGQKGVWIISQYDALRTQENLNLTSIAHEWMYVGHAFHRLSPVFRIKFKSGGSTPVGGKPAFELQDDGTGVYKGTKPLSLNGQRISNIADGTDAKDVVSKSQLDKVSTDASNNNQSVSAKIDAMFQVNAQTQKVDYKYNGDLNMNAKKLGNIADGVASQDAVSKKQAGV